MEGSPQVTESLIPIGSEMDRDGMKITAVQKSLPSYLPIELQNRISNMGGSMVELVIEKPLTKTDVNPYSRRLSVPLGQLRTHEFLTEKEKNLLKQGGEIVVRLIDPCIREFELYLREWHMKNSSQYVLVKQWISVVKSNKLKKDMVMQLWSFRAESQLCFALVPVKRSARGEERSTSSNNTRHVDGEVLYNVDVQEVEITGELTSRSSRGFQKTRPLSIFSKPVDPLRHAHVVKPITSVPHNDTPPISSIPHYDTPLSSSLAYNSTPLTFSYAAHLPAEVKASPAEKFGPDLIVLPSHPTREEWSSIITTTKSGSTLSGSSAMGQIDIGECEDSYLFRISLPGVKRDEREFSCEVESEGNVSIRGVIVTGEKIVCRYRQMFKMQSQNFCPPGHFSISFKLPGPVDPQQFSGNFGTDGILEGIVMKAQRKTATG